MAIHPFISSSLYPIPVILPSFTHPDYFTAIISTTTKVRKWVNGGGKLKVGGDVLVGLSRWETLVPKTKETDQLLKNMPEDDLWGATRGVDIYIYIYMHIYMVHTIDIL